MIWGPGVTYDKVLLFPITLITLDLGAAFMYALNLDWRRSVYWIAAAVLTACVTF